MSTVDFQDLICVAAVAVVYIQRSVVAEFPSSAKHAVDQNDIGRFSLLRMYETDAFRFKSVFSAGGENVHQAEWPVDQTERAFSLQQPCRCPDEIIQISGGLLPCRLTRRGTSHKATSFFDIWGVGYYKIACPLQDRMLPDQVLDITVEEGNPVRHPVQFTAASCQRNRVLLEVDPCDQPLHLLLRQQE